VEWGRFRLTESAVPEAPTASGCSEAVTGNTSRSPADCRRSAPAPPCPLKAEGNARLRRRRPGESRCVRFGNESFERKRLPESAGGKQIPNRGISFDQILRAVAREEADSSMSVASATVSWQPQLAAPRLAKRSFAASPNLFIIKSRRPSNATPAAREKNSAGRNV